MEMMMGSTYLYESGGGDFMGQYYNVYNKVHDIFKMSLVVIFQPKLWHF